MRSVEGFGIDQMRAAAAAYDLALAALGGELLPQAVREIVAEHIIKCVDRGELEPQRLCDCALEAIGVMS